ncbi:IS200/IS605 family transposase [Streptomyces sp. NBC_00841]|uniref:IS200/IS605 family transposase n=1 Tax=unclassified Streptomyces TaxID=2593676 RepID=UPI00224ED834|nr:MULTISPECIES: IS200/IS605 family transposase [unclassified Streptomyces]MCX4537860.1 IS200/IS605 family transposase [Streptomyces sp. NBC_01669]MCX4537916.1 IS200/IS605 family transposase [Streptomyces sp. NBC_01669]WRZ96684.1 IS200/IS605 family transposase [Streptomyces sp. NBC_00841]WRZ97233.1 IS200/IS605 family transposase [Streptomyces sp. NBC_00841]
MSPRWKPNPDIRTGRHVTYTLHAHLVFVTKYRRDIFDDAMLKRCEEIMREVCASFETELREFNGEADHVHLLVHYPPKVALSKLINSLKGVSSRYLRAEYTGRINRIGMGAVFWSRSYFAGSCGGAPLTVIRQYIEGQKRPI